VNALTRCEPRQILSNIRLPKKKQMLSTIRGGREGTRMAAAKEMETKGRQGYIKKNAWR
jgi:hypothetical protein